MAAFIAEPVMGEGGIIMPPREYFKEIKKVLDAHGILLFMDEVQSGFGRTGKMFAIEHYDVEPDILTMAKGIADGFPLSAFIARPEVADSFRPGDHLSTFGGNPVSCAAALANIAYFEREKLREQAAGEGRARVMAALKELQKTQPLIGDVRGLGLMVGIELVRDKNKTPAGEEAGKIRASMREKGFLIGVGGTWGNVLRVAAAARHRGGGAYLRGSGTGRKPQSAVSHTHEDLHHRRGGHGLALRRTAVLAGHDGRSL